MIAIFLSILLLAMPMVSTNSVDILENELNLLLTELEILDEAIEEKKTLVLSHYDEMNQLKKQVNKESKNENHDRYNVLVDHYKAVQKKYVEQRDKLDQLKNQRVELRNDISLAEAKLESENISINRNFVKPEKFNHKISIVLSETCKILINSGLDSNCPTYAQLAAYYDNTMPLVSGGFVQDEYDVYRDTGNDKDWRYYDQYPYWLIIAVDPHPEFLKRSEVITIQANDYPYVKNILNCDMFSTPPDLRSITDTINQAIYGCAPP